MEIKKVKEFIDIWRDIENYILSEARKYNIDVQTFLHALSTVSDKGQFSDRLINDLARLRIFCNKIQKSPEEIGDNEVKENINRAIDLKEELIL